jgi:hypothetical protein
MAVGVLGVTQALGDCLPTTSFATPAESTMTPTEVSSNFNSVNILQRTGKAYMNH